MNKYHFQTLKDVISYSTNLFGRIYDELYSEFDNNLLELQILIDGSEISENDISQMINSVLPYSNISIHWDFLDGNHQTGTYFYGLSILGNITEDNIYMIIELIETNFNVSVNEARFTSKSI